jgi:glycerophosphoryl diester phosphodiesterase
MGSQSKWFQDAPLVIAHRGASAYAPENTLPAFDLAFEMGADAIELDVRLSADRIAVVHHDRVVGRCARDRRPISRTSHRKLLSGGLLTLEEVLHHLAGRMLFNLELKVGARPLLHLMVEMIRSRGLSNQVLVSSFNPMTLWRFRRIDADLPIGYLLDRRSPGWLASIAKLLRPEFTLIHQHSPLLNRLIRSRGKRIIVWTVNRKERIRHLLDLGVGGIITDRPDAGREIVRDKHG